MKKDFEVFYFIKVSKEKLKKMKIDKNHICGKVIFDVKGLKVKKNFKITNKQMLDIFKSDYIQVVYINKMNK